MGYSLGKLKHKRTAEGIPSIKQALTCRKIKRSTDDLFVLLFTPFARKV